MHIGIGFSCNLFSPPDSEGSTNLNKEWIHTIAARASFTYCSAQQDYVDERVVWPEEGRAESHPSAACRCGT